MALRHEPGLAGADEARRLEIRAHGDPLRTRQRRRVGTHHPKAPWGKIRGRAFRESEKALIQADKISDSASIGNEEVDSSILSGSTSLGL